MRILLATLAVGLLACGDDGDNGDPPLFAVDYATAYEEVRNCRFSLDHDLQRIRILAAPDAVTPYRNRAAPFPTGAIVLKVEYADDDTSCAGPIAGFTVMQKLDTGSSSATLDWQWQKVDGKQRVMVADPMRCAQCHTSCGKPPEGFDGTCATP